MKETENSTVLYCAPNIKMFEINPDCIMCQSGDYDVNGEDVIWEDPE